MPQLNGFELVAWIKSNKPKTRVLVMSVDNSDYSVMKMCKLGAYGYFLKDDGLSKLPGAIREIAGGWYFLSDAIRYSVFTKEYFIKTFLLPGIADHRRNSMKII